MDNARLLEQFAYLTQIKSMRESRLRRLHKEVFRRTKFWFPMPKWAHRSVMERRLWYYYCAKNYHFPGDHPFTLAFKQKAKHILSKDYLKSSDPETEAKQRLKELTHFTKANVDTMSMVDVDRYLASLGLFIEGDEDTRRKVLWEWFNKPSGELIQHLNNKGRKVRAVRKGLANNRFYLRDLILAHPALPFDQFKEQFGEQMPTVSRKSYAVARVELRKAGYQLPRLRPGPSNPAVIRGVYGHLTKGRVLNPLVDEDDNG